MKLELNRENGVPLTEQIVNGVQAWIRSRAAHPGARLPSISTTTPTRRSSYTGMVNSCPSR